MIGFQSVCKGPPSKNFNKMAMIEGGMKCVKYALFAFNLVFLVSFSRFFKNFEIFAKKSGH